jgi:hypothetical protein
MIQSNTLSVEHIDPRWREGRDYQLICGFEEGPLANFNEVIADWSYNSRKSNRFVPYRTCKHSAPVTFGDIGEFLVEGEWVVCEFGGEIWWKESSRIGCGETARHGNKNAEGKSVTAVKAGRAAHKNRNKDGKSVAGLKSAEKLNSAKDENGKSAAAVKGGMKTHAEKDDQGRSVAGVRNGGRLNEEKDERGKSLNATKGGKAGAKVTHSQKWVCLVTGHISSPAGLSSWQIARGIDTKLRERIK